MRIAIRSPLRAFLVLGGLAGGVSAVGRAQQGTVAGRVTDQASGQPLVGARVTIVGTSLVASSRAEGRYQIANRSEEHTSELQSPCNLVCRLLLEKKKNRKNRRQSSVICVAR